MSTYVQIPRDAMLSKLAAAGFVQDTRQAGSEMVFIRQHHKDPTMFVKIYTSLSADANNARGKGADAIRVFLIFENGAKSGCLYKAKRVFRTGTVDGVLERMMERAREAYSEANRRYKERHA